MHLPMAGMIRKVFSISEHCFSIQSAVCTINTMMPATLHAICIDRHCII